MFILWYRGTITMKTYPTVEKKLADWTLAFNSMENQQGKQILNDLINGLNEKIQTVSAIGVTA